METIEDLERRLGSIIRGIRLNRAMSQEELSRLCDLSLTAIRNLEHGRGASLNTFLKAVRALERLDILDSLDEGFDDPTPMELLRISKNAEPRIRRAPRKAQQ